MRRLLLVSVSGVFLDAYDISIISLAILQIEVQYHATSVQVGLVGAAVLIGNFIGALAFGRIADRIGRRRVFVISVIFFVVFPLLSGLVLSLWQLIMWRFLLGIGIGADYALASPFVAEAVPARIRGRVLTVNWGVAWFAGELVSFVVAYAILATGSPNAWRWMLMSGAVPAVVVLLLRRSVPESARWLASQGRREEGIREATRLTDDTSFHSFIAEHAAYSGSRTESAWHDVWGKYRRRTWFGLLNYFCEGAPFYALSVFLPTILRSGVVAKGATEIASLTLLLQAIAAVGLLIAYLLVDRIGRRFINYLGYAGMLCALLIYELVFPLPEPVLLVLFIIIEIALWTGPAVTDNLLLGELWPTEIRTTGAGIGAAAGRVGATVGTFMLPVLTVRYGLSIALWLPTAFCAFGLLNTVVLGVETMGKTLEELAE